MANEPKKTSKSPPKRINKKAILEKLNVPRIICFHLLGENHSEYHRMSVGVIIMASGVLMAEFNSGIIIIHFIGNMFGYLLHGIGSIPFVEELSKYLAKNAPKSDIKAEEVQDRVEEEA